MDSMETGSNEKLLAPYCEANELMKTISNAIKTKNFSKESHSLRDLEAIITNKTEKNNESKNKGWEKSNAARVIERAQIRMERECIE